MADSILVIVEQREGKLNRVSWETLTAGQALAAETGWTLEAAVAGSGVTNFANEIAGKKVAKVCPVESKELEPYTPRRLRGRAQAIYCVTTTQAGVDAAHLSMRDFAAQAGHRDGAHRHQRLHRLQERRRQTAFHPPDVFQGKLAADVSFACDPPWFVTFQNGAFRGTTREAGSGAAPVETVSVQISDGVVRNQPQEVLKEAKQAVDLTQAEIIVSVGRGIKEQKNIELAKQLAEALGGEIAASRPICDSDGCPWTARSGRPGRPSRPSSISP